MKVMLTKSHRGIHIGEDLILDNYSDEFRNRSLGNFETWCSGIERMWRIAGMYNI